MTTSSCGGLSVSFDDFVNIAYITITITMMTILPMSLYFIV